MACEPSYITACRHCLGLEDVTEDLSDFQPAGVFIAVPIIYNITQNIVLKAADSHIGICGTLTADASSGNQPLLNLLILNYRKRPRTRGLFLHR